MMKNKLLLILPALLLVVSCNAKTAGESDPKDHTVPEQPDVTVQTQDFKDYWYAGKAELSHYDLEQIRYGEVHDGDAMLVFVTEDFLTEPQVKLESPADGRSTQTVLKLNRLKEFVTGIYEYKVMTSVFTPVNSRQHPRSLKVSFSSQEWCGIVYSQLNLRGGQYDITGHSYFENEADYESTLDAVWLEDEIWTQLRLSPQLLPEGEIDIIPASFGVRRGHTGWQIEKASTTRKKYTGVNMPGDSLMAYSVDYTDLNRNLTIVYEPQSPYRIAGWVETQQATNGDTLRAKSVRTHSIKEPYWKLNANSDEELRQKLGLDTE